jgi:putative ABC transport system permease protein
VDVEQILRSVQEIVDRIALVIQFMALFSIAVGLVILGGTIAVTKYQRLRESVLLKTLGATRAAVAVVLSTEYAVLGALAGAVGAVAAGALSWGLVTFVFEGLWDWRWPPYLAAAALASLLTTAVGLASNLDILNRKPLQVLREE